MEGQNQSQQQYRRRNDNRRGPQQQSRKRQGGNRQQNRGNRNNLRANYNKVSENNQQNIQNQIRVSKKNSPTNYISRAAKLFLGFEDKEDSTKNVEKHDTVIITAMGPAIPIALTTATKVRELLGGLHQVLDIKIETIIDVFEPKIEGLEKVEEKRQQGVLEITLSRSAEGLADKVGYSAPTDAAKEVQVQDIIRERQGRPHQHNGDRRNNYNGQDRKRQYRSRSPRGQGQQQGDRRYNGNRQNNRSYGRRAEGQNQNQQQGGQRRRYNNQPRNNNNRRYNNNNNNNNNNQQQQNNQN